jgi:hypothetical protein
MKISELIPILLNTWEVDGNVEIEVDSDDAAGPLTWVELYHGKFLMGTGEKPKFDHRPADVIEAERQMRIRASYAQRNRELGGLLP